MSARPMPPGDMPPNYGDNNAWKRRLELTPADRRAGEDAARRVRPALERLRKAGDISPEAVRKALEGLGFPGDRMGAQPFRSVLVSPPPAGAVYYVRVGEIACVTGSVRPEGVLVEVGGPTGEGTCLEPFSH
ncbi:hypothetical protein DPM19_33455 [Actinomadura craniellae]|uniref:Uncharacterized protein n=1 Tax=Actinomadura craniellae TaxID=2231787 RepID=A0A365GVN2_9ACTN|nr:hypothetical protein DPM19_33455 [Actinomadura craniellae]